MGKYVEYSSKNAQTLAEKVSIRIKKRKDIKDERENNQNGQTCKNFR